MQYVITSEEMKRYDANTMQKHLVPSCVLMEKAAEAVAHEIFRLDADGKILVVCGSGNNGGDGMAVARILMLAGCDVTVVFVGNEAHLSEEARRQKDILLTYNVKPETEIPAQKYAVVVDAIFGIGLSREVTGRYRDIIDTINDMDAYKIAVDIASGLDANTGQGHCVHADMTVTFGFAKYGHLLYPGRLATGKLIVSPIGITKESFYDAPPKGYYYTAKDTNLLPARFADSNKGSYGKVFVVAGSKNMAGAACFAAEASYRVGAGLVYLYTPEENRLIVQTRLPEAVLCNEEEMRPGSDDFCKRIHGADAIVLGCGLGTDESAYKKAEAVLSKSCTPVVIDADALNLIAAKKELTACMKQSTCVKIMTPHPGEAARLLHTTIDEVKKDLIAGAQKIAEIYGVICVLKDAVTIVTDADRIYVNTSGCNGMAKGGSGDVLAGMIGGLIAQHQDPFDAATTGVYLHGLCGQKAQEKHGSYAMTATDLLAQISTVTQEMENLTNN